ncbi:hypothetical protein [Pantoea piersonii]|uniref:hypothetical protein n=1 Tax=Pantoea piersonii TaxID=2364647 RepID=UPI0022F178D8|nr:hypothetical protein [Pantoea piersonii]WBV20673.1 hypothetical protein PG877_13805 [Pantoea piersonii]
MKIQVTVVWGKATKHPYVSGKGDYVGVDEININPSSVELADIGTRLAECF